MRIREVFIKTVASFFYLGYLPLMPGTFGSAGGLLAYYLVKDNPCAYALLTAALLAAGFSLSGEAERLFNRKDSSRIVIDEASGMLIALIFIPYDIKSIISAFLLFRLFDTLKPFPTGRLQNLKGGAGVMMDDIIAALYTNVLLQVVLRSALFKTS